MRRAIVACSKHYDSAAPHRTPRPRHLRAHRAQARHPAHGRLRPPGRARPARGRAPLRPARVKDLAADLHVDLSVASRQVAALEAAGYVKREPDPDDRRSARVTTTAAGDAALKTAHERIVGVFAAALAGWSAEDAEPSPSPPPAALGLRARRGAGTPSHDFQGGSVTAAAQIPQAARPAMTHRQVLEAMSGLLLGMFVAILSSTVVSTSLPRIITDLGGGQSVLHLGRHLDAAGADGDHPDLGQARRPLRPQALVQTALVIYVARLDPRRPVAVDRHG